jgi:hypothetical protein
MVGSIVGMVKLNEYLSESQALYKMKQNFLKLRKYLSQSNTARRIAKLLGVTTLGTTATIAASKAIDMFNLEYALTSGINDNAAALGFLAMLSGAALFANTAIDIAE